MRTIKVILFLLYLVTVIPIYSQESIPKVTDENTLKDMHIFNKDTVIAVGDKGGKLLKTYDGGQNWFVQNLETNNSIMSIYFIDSIGWAVGEYNTLFKSYDRGESWTKLEVFTINGYLNSVFFIDKNKGWILDQAYIYMSSDGGMTWNKQDCNTSGNTVNEVFFIDDSTGWIVGGSWPNKSGIILKTTDSGLTWNKIYSEWPAPICDIYFINRNIGWAVGDESLILKTVDGGSHWEKQDCSIYEIFLSVFFVDSSKGFVVGSGPSILETSNGGEEWRINSYPTTTRQQYNFVSFVDDQNGFIVGTNDIILCTTNSGKDWVTQNITTSINRTQTASIDDFILHQNYPNPFNLNTRINLEVPFSTIVKVSVYNLLGKKVKNILFEKLNEGNHLLEWDGKDESGTVVTSGVYFITMTTNQYRSTIKALLLK